MTQQEFEDLKKQFEVQVEHLRYGQRVFVALWKNHESIAKEINGTKIDPFYNDNNVPNLINYIQEFHVK